MDINQAASASDEDFLKNFEQILDKVPESGAAPETPEPPPPEPTPEVEPSPAVPEELPAEGQESPADGETAVPGSVESDAALNEGVEAEEQPAQPKTPEPKPVSEAAQVEQYKSLYEKVMAPFKASGKTIQLKDPEEALELIKKGVDYTRKTMEIAADRKFLVMLEKNQLKDEAKLSFLIDLANKNPEAIKKLVTDSGVDPLDIDTSAPSSYSPGNHSVSDDEIRFTETLTEVNSTPEGQQVVQRIFSGWDQASQGHMWKEPEAMRVLLAQKQSGVFDIVEGEVERRRLLGQIPATTSYLDAYRYVGLELGQAGAFNHLPAFQGQVAAAQHPAANSPIATRAASTVAKPAADPTVRAAAPTRPTARMSSKPTIDDLADLSDEEFLKRFPTI